MDGCMRPRVSEAAAERRRPDRLRIHIPGSPASVRAAPRCQAVSRRPGTASGPSSACRPGRRRAPGLTRHRAMVRPVGAAGPGDRLWYRHLDAAMAKAEPHIDVIAVEVYRRGLAQLLGAIDRDGITNIRLIRGDGVDVWSTCSTPSR